RLGEVRVVVGDRPSTDGALATRLGARFALVLSGVTPPGHGPLDPVPDLEAPDLARVVDRLAIGEG
ncbi:MAG TPA: HAD hydrolase-like protein, partial [Acidimicrobiales bacterium]|nr:HAD hydrolase-like protein [Acidimicrobiales bacterium]